MQKILLLGFHKTGTTSVTRALEFLGYTASGHRDDLLKPYFEGNFEPVIEATKGFDVFQDDPWFLFYEKFNEWYPDAIFILIKRDPEKWVKSVQNHFGTWPPNDTRDHLYGNASAFTEPDRYIDVFRRHLTDVEAYFEDRPGKLLTFSMAEGDGWQQLCDFIGKPVPKTRTGEPLPFPRVNQKTDRSAGLSRIFLRKIFMAAKGMIGRNRASKLRAWYQCRFYKK